AWRRNQAEGDPLDVGERDTYLHLDLVQLRGGGRVRAGRQVRDRHGDVARRQLGVTEVVGDDRLHGGAVVQSGRGRPAALAGGVGEDLVDLDHAPDFPNA